MRTSVPVAFATLLAAACVDDEPLPTLMDTGWFDSDVPADDACTAVLVSSSPEAGVRDWYWRDLPRLFVAEPDAAHTARLTEASGIEVPVTLTPANEAGLALDVVFDGGLKPDTDHVLEFTDCSGTHEIAFRTSSYGRPVEGGVAGLAGHTFHLDVADAAAQWLQPSGLGPLLSSFFAQPILVSVQWAGAGSLDLIGGLGDITLGEISQDEELPTWNFPVAEFSDAPFFSVDADAIELLVSGYPLPIYNFHLEGTFAADGQSIGGARLRGLGDTRYSGGAVGFPNREEALCDLGAGVGVACVACPDGRDLCLAVEVEEIPTPWIEGLRMEPRRGDVP
jgi:hypothetical protein